MESTASSGGARPKEKTQSVGDVHTGFGRFLVDLKNSLTNDDDIRLIMTALEFKPAERDKVENSADPGDVFVHSLKKQGMISRTDISLLTEKLKICGLHGVADDVNESFRRYLSQTKPQLSSSQEYEQGYGQFLLTLALLICSHSHKLATWFGYPAGMIDSINSSDNPGQVFVQFMDDRGEITPTDISTLINALENKTVGLGGVARKVKEAFRQHVLTIPPTPLTVTPTPPIVPPTPPIVPPTPPIVPPTQANEKKTQFVTELQMKYKILCGDIQPAPFLRDNYNIDKLFVENGIKFLEDKQGESKEQEKWTMLKDYKTVFTNPNIKSKRRIIDGEPGYGKSTLALQITHDWCQGTAPMNEFQILILLRLRQFRNVTTVYSAIKKFLLQKDSKLTEDDIKSILDSSSTVILLDGYDEYPDLEKEDTDINHIIRGDMFQKHDVVLLTRTSCLPPDHSNTTIKRMRLTGFDDTSRETYIRNVVARGCSDVADGIITFLKVNPVPADLCKIPLFFAMISYMVKNSEIFRNLKTVTQFFQHIIKCFHSHRKITVTDENRREELDHGTLDKVAFEGLSGDAQQISWGKNKLRSEIGKDLYDEYVRVGILIEEEGFDYDTLKYNTETRFFHKLFAEWYAAHYLAKLAAQSEDGFAFWRNLQRRIWRNLRRARRAADTSQLSQVADSDKLLSLKSLNPHELHYMYRYACGLNPRAALKIIKHLGKNKDYDEYTLLCMTEWSGSLETIKDTVTLLCSREIHIRDTHSLLLQKSTVALIEFASSQKIPMTSVYLYNCLDVGYNGNMRIKPSKLHLPVMDTLSVLWISERGREITEEETDSILQYSAKCLGLKLLWFNDCLVPRYIKVTESMSVLRQRHVSVRWDPGIYDLNLESGQWEWGRTLMTDEQYQKAVEKVRKWGEIRKQLLGKD